MLINVKSFSTKLHKVHINCIDVTTREIIYSWIVRVETKKPKTSNIYKIDA